MAPCSLVHKYSSAYLNSPVFRGDLMTFLFPDLSVVMGFVTEGSAQSLLHMVLPVVLKQLTPNIMSLLLKPATVVYFP